MKLSLAWIFDHLNADWRTQNVDHIYAQFNRITAEMEGVECINHDLSSFFFGSIQEISDQAVTFIIPELSEQVALAMQPGMAIGQSFLLKKTEAGFIRATHADFGGDKEGALPTFDCDAHMLQGGWRDLWQKDDVIIEVDNKSITHRPDMWSHRGFAREIGAFLGIKLKQEANFLTPIPVVKAAQKSLKTPTMPISITLDAQQACSRFTALYVQEITNKPCNLLIASRLLNIGARPMDGIVDVANYVMFDWGQPVHTYDAASIADGNLVVRMAKAGETMSLLGGIDITLNGNDTVVTDAQKLLCLAGIKGGSNSGIQASTEQMLFEAATWDAGIIRKSAQRHKMRTDASTRYEKTLDPEQTWQAAQRFISLLKQVGIDYAHAPAIVQVGADLEPTIIEVTNIFLEERIGMSLEPAMVIKILTDLEFCVAYANNTYTITVPSLRASKDIKIKEDILEEVVRCYGFDNITRTLPMMLRNPFSLQSVQRRLKIKEYFVHTVRMFEQQNYALADTQFCTSLGYQPAVGMTLVNPLAENFAQMVTSLIPNLLKNIVENNVHRDTLAFFEVAKIWPFINGAAVEQRSVSGVYFAKRQSVDFYTCKHDIAQLFAALGLNGAGIDWQKATRSLAPWYHPHQTAQIVYEGLEIGFLGKINPTMAPKLGIDTDFDAVLFELNGDFLEQEKPHVPAYESISKFQDTYIDLSLMVPLALPAAQLVAKMQSVHTLIKRIEQLDCFENAAWAGVRALTYRLWLSSTDRTLEKHEIDAVWNNVVEDIKTVGVQVRV